MILELFWHASSLSSSFVIPATTVFGVDFEQKSYFETGFNNNPMENKLIISRIGRIRDKANTFLSKQLEDHGMKGIVPSHGEILWKLFSFEELSMTDLARHIHRDKSTVTALVNKLIKFGYVKKRTSENDSRVNLISLTPKARNLEKSFWAISQALQEKAYKGLSEKEKAALVSLLDKIDRNL